jgi:hypothetical protein
MFSKLNKIVLRIVSLTLVMIIFYAFLSFLIGSSILRENINVSVECNEINATEKECEFVCYTLAECQKPVTSRIVVLHSGLVALYDKMFNASCNETHEIIVDIPRRNYTYNVRTVFYNDEEFGRSLAYMNC